MTDPVFETVVIRSGDDGAPTIQSITIAAQTMGIGMTVIGDFEAVRLPHPRPVVDAILRLAHTWDATARKIKAVEDGTPMERDPLDFEVRGCNEGHVHIWFTRDTGGVAMTRETAVHVARDLLDVATGDWTDDEKDNCENH